MARRKHYKNEGLIKLCVILGGIIGFFTQLFTLVGPYNLYPLVSPYWLHGGYYIIILIIGMVISVLTILCGLRKQSKSGGEILPFHWLTFIILAILLIVFGGGIWACVLLIIAFLIALIEDL